jgi:hypothetical protein
MFVTFSSPTSTVAYNHNLLLHHCLSTLSMQLTRTFQRFAKPTFLRGIVDSGMTGRAYSWWEVCERLLTFGNLNRSQTIRNHVDGYQELQVQSLDVRLATYQLQMFVKC